MMLTGCNKNKPNNNPGAEPSVSAAVAEAPDTSSTEVTTPVSEPEPAEASSDAVEIHSGDIFMAEEGVYSFLDYSFEIPKEWHQKVYVQAYDETICFYQRKSYEEGQGGFLFSFDRSDNQPCIYTEGKMVAYNKDAAYFVMYPSDVPYVVEDAQIVDDYVDLANKNYMVLESWKIKDDSTRYDAEEYICPMSDIKPIPTEVFENMYYTDLQKARREIYARHGMIFDDYNMNNYFNSLSWYKGTTTETEFDYDSLSQVEEDNLSLIESKISELFADCPTNYQLGETTTQAMAGDGSEDLITVTCEGEPGDNYEYIFDINGNQFSSANLGVEIENPDEYYYITNLSPYYKSKQIAVVDLGMDDNHSTHFFWIDENGQLNYIGRIEGDAFANTDGNLDGFDHTGNVRESIRSYLFGTHRYYRYIWYNGEEHSFNYPDDEYVMQHNLWPEEPHKLLKDIEVSRHYESIAPDEYFTMKAGERIAFLSTDDSEFIQIKSVDTGKKGYLHVDDELNQNYSSYFEGLY